MAWFKNCMSYPCPYDPSALRESKPKYNSSRTAFSEKATGKVEASREPPPYTEIASPTSPSTPCSAPNPQRPCRLSRYQFACPACRCRCLHRKLKSWVVDQRKPFSAVSVQVDRLTSEQFEEDDLSGIIDLIEVIRIQSSGPTEAARALRKKLSVYHWVNLVRALH